MDRREKEKYLAYKWKCNPACQCWGRPRRLKGIWKPDDQKLTVVP